MVEGSFRVVFCNFQKTLILKNAMLYVTIQKQCTVGQKKKKLNTFINSNTN